jgi:glycosyltransferase involved in cell wall biosynthesis
MGVPLEFVLDQPRCKPVNYVIGTAGFFDHSKSPFLVLQTFMLIAKKHSDAIFEWLGEIDLNTQHSYGLHWQKAGLELSRLRFLGYQNETDFRKTLQTWTCAIQLRKHSNGESSGIVMELAANGTPCVVTDIGSFKELSDHLFVKADLTENPKDIYQLVEKVIALSPNDWSKLSDELREEARLHSFESYSEAILDIIQS